jgi:transcriptional regulator with XRE-family HTH domain
MERPFIHTARTSEHMSAVEYHERTRVLLARLEQRERERAPDISTARKRLARRLGALPGTIENFARGRIKRADAYLRARIEALLVQELTHEIAALSHELDCLKATASHPACDAVSEIEAALATAKSLMRGQP